MQAFSLNRNQLLALGIVLGAVFVALFIFVVLPKLKGRIAEGPPGPTPEEGVAALVNNEPILRDAFEARFAADLYFYTVIAPPEEKTAALPRTAEGTIEIDPATLFSQEEVAALRRQTLEDMIQEKLLTDLLAQHGLSVSDNEVRQRIEEIVVDTQFGGDWEAYETDLTSVYRTTLDEVMRTVRIDMLREKAAELKSTQRVFAIWVEKKQPQFVAYESMTPEQRAELEGLNREKKEKAERAFARIQAEEDFAAVARDVSEHEASAQNGGDLGLLALPTDVPLIPDAFSFPLDIGFFEAVRELGVGEARLSEGFTGYFIVKIAEVKQGPLGTQGFDDWYANFRAQADVQIFL